MKRNTTTTIQVIVSSRPKVKLLGTDGNAFSILGRAARAQRAAGWSESDRDAWRVEATSGDYDHLLGWVMETMEVE